MPMVRVAAVSGLAALLLAATAAMASADEKQDTCSRMAGTIEEALACLQESGSSESCEPPERMPLVRPIPGSVVLRFGERTQYGTVSKGVVLQGQRGTTVRAPAGGSVIFAGEFRTYGQLVVLQPACGLRVLLAGLSTVDVARGQDVTAGHTIGNLSAAEGKEGLPVLYVELRRLGIPVDPGSDISGP